MGHKTRWQARFEGRDGETYLTRPEDERRMFNIKRARVARSEVEAEDRAIELKLGLRVR